MGPRRGEWVTPRQYAGNTSAGSVKENNMTQTQWNSEVLERDDYTCQRCGANTCLDAAHIIARSQAPQLRYDTRNGITLCRSCHQRFHQHPLEWREFLTTRQQ